jgi:hypothetical protein
LVVATEYLVVFRVAGLGSDDPNLHGVVAVSGYELVRLRCRTGDRHPGAVPLVPIVVPAVQTPWFAVRVYPTFLVPVIVGTGALRVPSATGTEYFESLIKLVYPGLDR